MESLVLFEQSPTGEAVPAVLAGEWFTNLSLVELFMQLKGQLVVASDSTILAAERLATPMKSQMGLEQE